MAKSNAYSSTEVKAGVFLTFCLALFVAMLFLYGKANRIWRGREELTVVFTSVTSLRPDAPVRLNGVEVGRVKQIAIQNLKGPYLERIPTLGPGDLDHLPLTAEERLELRKLPVPPPEADEATRQEMAQKFDAAVREKIGDRTMIELVLEVLNPRSDEGETKRYRVDDQVRITTTLLGDTSVEIASGNGPGLPPGNQTLILGRSGDFFTNLGKSVEQVKDILASVSDVVGTEERESVRKALRRFDSITRKIEGIVDLANDRLPETWNKIDALADSAKTDLDAIGKAVNTLQPQVSKTLTAADEAIKDLQKRLGDLADESRQAVVDVKGQVKPVLEDVHYITSHSKEDFPQLVNNAKDLAARLKQSADKLDRVLSTSDQLLNQSYPDLRRLILAFRRGAENFEEATYVLKTKPWLMANKPRTEDPPLEAASQAARKLELAMMRFRELHTELQAVQRNLPKKPNQTQIERLDILLQELGILVDTLNDASDPKRKEALAPFDRKAGRFVDFHEGEATK